ncbi:hypothetical protein GmHk_02G004234 [Glycine max]|nr:hypothetical protein GmHk_02G004234 [Glycine max]
MTIANLGGPLSRRPLPNSSVFLPLFLGEKVASQASCDVALATRVDARQGWRHKAGGRKRRGGVREAEFRDGGAGGRAGDDVGEGGNDEGEFLVGGDMGGEEGGRGRGHGDCNLAR